MRAFLVLAAASLLATSCASGPGGYWTSRGRDLTDVAYVHVTGFSVGAMVNVGPAMVGYYDVFGLFDHAESNRFGLGGTKDVEFAPSHAAGVLLPWSWLQSSDPDGGGYGSHSPGWGSVGIDLGYGLGIGARVDFVEFVDLVVGMTGFDILGDDVPRGYRDADPAYAEDPAAEDEDLEVPAKEVNE